MPGGLDSSADGRAFAWLDFNRDGLRDVVLTNANAPRVELYQNQMDTDHHWLALRLVGGNEQPRASAEWSNRDGVGAVIRVGVESHVEVLERRSGEGFAAQNSDRLLVGMGTAASAQWIEVRWPSGKVTRHEGPWMSGQEVVLRERD